jgi:microsomal dipeptidase-like Zn-dependent dipeptidase
MSGRNRFLLAATAVLVVATAGLLAWLPGAIERSIGHVEPHAPYEIGEAAAALHERLVVADLHADSLLWKRDLLEWSDRGQVDLPRLARGNVAVQVFTAVTKSPSGQNYEQNAADTDTITWLTLAQLWPPATWHSLLARALHQGEKLHALARRAPEAVRVVRDRADLEAVLAARADGAETVAGVLGIEGAHALEGRLENLDRLHEAGFRVVGLQHFFDNELGGSLHGESSAGLSDFGRQVVGRANALGMVVDLAHSSPAVVDDVLAATRRPVIVSHTGVQGACPSARNLADDQMRRVAEAGGVVGIGYWEGAVCDVSPAGVVRSVRYAIDLLGEEHVALGSDYDGSVVTTFDTSELAVLTHTMLEARFSEREIAAVMGENVVRVLRATLSD